MRATSHASFRRFSASRPHFPPFFILHITQASCAVFFLLLFLVPHQVSNHLPFAYVSLTSLSSTPLHHEIQLRFIPPKLIFILLDSLACPKINITIYYMLHACSVHAARCTKTCIVFVGPWRLNDGGDDLFFLPIAST